MCWRVESCIGVRIRRFCGRGIAGILVKTLVSLLGAGSQGVQVKISPCGGFLAYTLQLGPDEACCGRVRDLGSGSFLAAAELASAVSLEWAGGAATLLFTLPDELGRPHKVGLFRALGRVLALKG